MSDFFSFWLGLQQLIIDLLFSLYIDQLFSVICLWSCLHSGIRKKLYIVPENFSKNVVLYSEYCEDNNDLFKSESARVKIIPVAGFEYLFEINSTPCPQTWLCVCVKRDKIKSIKGAIKSHGVGFCCWLQSKQTVWLYVSVCLQRQEAAVMQIIQIWKYLGCFFPWRKTQSLTEKGILLKSILSLQNSSKYCGSSYCSERCV